MQYIDYVQKGLPSPGLEPVPARCLMEHLTLNLILIWISIFKQQLQ